MIDCLVHEILFLLSFCLSIIKRALLTVSVVCVRESQFLTTKVLIIKGFKNEIFILNDLKKDFYSVVRKLLQKGNFFIRHSEV